MGRQLLRSALGCIGRAWLVFGLPRIHRYRQETDRRAIRTESYVAQGLCAALRANDGFGKLLRRRGFCAPCEAARCFSGGELQLAAVAFVAARRRVGGGGGYLGCRFDHCSPSKF